MRPNRQNTQGIQAVAIADRRKAAATVLGALTCLTAAAVAVLAMCWQVSAFVMHMMG